MKIQVLAQKITGRQLAEWAAEGHGDMIKAVVDVERELLAVGGELHADAEATLLEKGSKQESLWGINLYPGKPAADRIEYHSLINVKPRQKHRSMDIQDLAVRDKIIGIVNRWVEW